MYGSEGSIGSGGKHCSGQFPFHGTNGTSWMFFVSLYVMVVLVFHLTCVLVVFISVVLFVFYLLQYTAKSVALRSNQVITDNSLTKLTILMQVDLSWNNTITDNSLTKLTNLTQLDLVWNTSITDNSLTKLTNLIQLNLHCNKVITDNSLTNLTKLINQTFIVTKSSLITHSLN